MILTPQEASIMRGRPYDKVMQGLQRALAVNELHPLKDSDGSIVAVLDHDEIIPFTIPQQVFDAMGREYFCIDLRKGNREYILDEATKSYEPRILTEANFLTNHALAQKIWLHRISDFNPIYWDSGMVYAMWIGMKVGKRLALTAVQQTELICYFAYFYFTQPYRGTELQPIEYNQLLSKISTLLRFNVNEVESILAPFSKKLYTTLDEFCEDVANTTVNPKLKKFNRVLVQTLLIGGWMGQNARELTALAVEYPPTFMTMLYRALNERSLKDSDITQVALKLMNTTKQKQFSLIFADILKRATES